MALYELSIEPALVREAEKVVSLEGRGYPTLAMRWESRLFDQVWQTTVVLDYLIALPPLIIGQTSFNEVKVCAFVGGAATKFLYFGTEMTANVPRVAPEMENSVAPAQLYQEFRLEESSCPLPYLKLIQTTPRIYGNGPQDYYSPPIKVERYDAVPGTDLLADFFASVVANLDPTKGSVLTDPSKGFWNGARFVGVTAIAIVRQGKVVGLHQRLGRADKDALPPEIKRREPKQDSLKEWVGIDFGTRGTVVGLRGERTQPEFVRIGPVAPLTVAADNETPSEISFVNLSRTLKAWRDRVILPLTRWEDVQIGFAARDQRSRPGDDLLQRRAATVQNLAFLRDRTEKGESMRYRGLSDAETNEPLKRPSAPIIDEEGIGAHDPFDAIELFAYYIGLHVNHRMRGLHTRYAIAMPTGWSSERRKSVVIAFRRGFFRSLPAGFVDYHDLERFEVTDAGPSAIAFAVQAFRTFNIQPKPDGVPFAVIDSGASETSFMFGILRPAKQDERTQGNERMIEHLEPVTVAGVGGERILHRLAYRVYVHNEFAMREARAPMEKPHEEHQVADVGELLNASPEARANTETLKDVLRPILEGTAGPKMPTTVKLLGSDNVVQDVPTDIDREAIVKAIHGFLSEAATAFKAALADALTRIGKDPDPYDGLRVLIGGRLGLHPAWGEELARLLPGNVQIHKFKEPDKTNIGAPTVRTAAALGVLGMKWDRTGATIRAEKRENFRYRVGRNRHGQLADVLDPSVEYDAWREMGACLKPVVDVLFMLAEDDGEVAADDPRVAKASCKLGANAVGQRLYARAIGPSRVEISVGPPGGEPDRGGPCWAIELKTGAAEQL